MCVMDVCDVQDLLVEVGNGGIINNCSLTPRRFLRHPPNKGHLLKICAMLQGDLLW